MTKATVNLIYPKDGWILNRYGEVLEEHLPNVRPVHPNKLLDFYGTGLFDSPNTINHYIPYANYAYRSKAIDSALFTHVEEEPQNSVLRQKFFQAVELIDLAVFCAPQYLRLCSQFKKISCVILPGIDAGFTVKLNLGVSGRDYNYTSRKNPELMRKLSEIDWINLNFSGGELSRSEMPGFYQRQDYTLVVSKVEGGPMSVMESLAVGKEVIFPRGVGFGELFEGHLHFYELDRFDSLILLLRRLYNKKKATSDAVQKYTWSRFVEMHAELFDRAISIRSRT